MVIESLNLKLDDYVEFVIEDGAVKIKKCTDENVIKTKVRYANKRKETN